jgi:O-antigen ligase
VSGVLSWPTSGAHEVDVENIVSSGRRQRFFVGVAIAIVAIVTTVALIRTDAIAVWFVFVFVLVLLAALMFLQARDHT